MIETQAARHSRETRDLLLAAARQEFAAYGIAGARVDRIAKLAGVNKERIYGHFGSKEKLFDAAVTEALDELAAAVPLTSGIDPAEYAGQVYDFHREHPTLLRLFLWEALYYREEALPNESERASRYREKVGELARGLGVPPSREVADILLSLISLAAWPNAVPWMARMITGESTETEEYSLAMRKHVVQFAANALASVRVGGTRSA